MKAALFDGEAAELQGRPSAGLLRGFAPKNFDGD